eukprot:Awhi_evm1s4780
MFFLRSASGHFNATFIAQKEGFTGGNSNPTNKKTGIFLYNSNGIMAGRNLKELIGGKPCPVT